MRVALHAGNMSEQRQRDGEREQKQGEEAYPPDAGGHHTDARRQRTGYTNNRAGGGVFGMCNIDFIRRQTSREAECNVARGAVWAQSGRFGASSRAVGRAGFQLCFQVV